MSRPTVIHIDGERGLRGGENQLLILARELEARGYRNIVACRPGAELDARARRAGLEVLNLPFLTELDPVSAWRLRQAALACERPILHSHTSHAASLSYLAASRTDLPRVSHRRVAFAPGPWSFSIKYKSARAVVAVSEFARRRLLEAGLASARAFVVPDALPSEFSLSAARAARASRGRLAASLGVPAEAVWIGQLAALTAEKDQATLLRAFARVRERRPEALLLIAGEGPLEAPLKAFSKDLGVAPSVRFLGYRDDAAGLLACLDLYVQSSTDEGLGSVVLEAMASGVPVVASRSGGLPELVRDGETGWLATPSDPASFASVIEAALGAPAERRSRAEAALAGLAEYSIEKTAERMERVYEFASSPRSAVPA